MDLSCFLWTYIYNLSDYLILVFVLNLHIFKLRISLLTFFIRFLYLLSREFNHSSLNLSVTKELSLCHKLWFSKPSILGTQYREPLIFQTYIIWSNRSHSLKCQRSTTLGCKNIGKRKSEFVTKNQFLFRTLILLAYKFSLSVWVFVCLYP